MTVRTAFIALALLGVAVSAMASASTGVSNPAEATAQAQPAVRINQFLSGDIWIYYKNRNRYHRLAYHEHVRIFNRYAAVSFTNTASQPIEKISFEFAAYGDDYRPVVSADGQQVVKQLVAQGPFAPGTSHTLVNANVVWSLPAQYSLGCVLLNGMQIVYANGSSAEVHANDVSRYLAPQLSNSCGVPPGGHRSRYWTGPSPFIAGVYPTRWMTLGERQTLYLQPFVPPSASQPLCAVGSLLEETCGFTARTLHAEGMP